MKKETLKVCRIFVPGIFLFIFSLPLVHLVQPHWVFTNSIFNIDNSEVNFWGYIIIIIFLGAFYYIVDIRRFFLVDSLEKIQANIKFRLLSLCLNDQEISYNFMDLLKNKKVMLVFYNIIDNDNSLQSKMMDVYLNGLIWSSIADLIAIGILYSIIYLILYWIGNDSNYLIYSTIMGLLSLISAFVFLPLITKKHIAKSNEQLDQMSMCHKNEICDQLKRIIKEK